MKRYRIQFYGVVEDQTDFLLYDVPVNADSMTRALHHAETHYELMSCDLGMVTKVEVTLEGDAE